jgi:hypothetical protein
MCPPGLEDVDTYEVFGLYMYEHRTNMIVCLSEVVPDDALMLASPDFYQNSVAYFNIESRRLSATDTVLGFTGIAAVCRSKSNLQFATYKLFGSGQI